MRTFLPALLLLGAAAPWFCSDAQSLDWWNMEQMRARSGREEAESGAEGAGPRRVRRKLREGVKVHYVDLDEEYPGPFPQFVTLLWWILDQEDGTVKYNLSGEGAGTIFDLDENNGKLYATRRLDREVKSIYILWANVVNKTTGLELIPESKVVIEIDDINDNEPIFSKEVYTGSVPERAERGTSVIQVTATDADYGKNATLVYSIRQGHPYFSVDLNTGVIRTALGPEHMDRVQREHYQVVIQAKDRPRLSGGLTGTTIVNITLTDVNNNPPLFNQSIYEFRVLESSKNGSVVGRVRATDRDIGQNAEMFFTIVGGDGMDVFQISTDKETQEGIITVREPLDFERKQLYTVEIQVENTHVDQRFPLAGIKDNATVRISVEDVDEEPPQFDKAWYMMEVKEDAEVGTTVGAVSAVDPDGSRIPIKYAIDRRTDLDRVFDIHPGNGSIFLLSPIDREENAWHNISVIASEFNNPRQNSSVNVYIRVLDVNDNPPCFNQSIYEFLVLESSKNGSVVGRVRAIDRDIGQNAEMFFTIVGGDGMDVFQISTDKETQEGIITVREPLDFERKQLYTVEIQVENTHVDQRFPLAGIKDNATVRISVEDVDEEPPQFDKAWYMMEVKEDAEVGTTVGAVSAVDPDGSRIPIKYAIDRRTDLDRVFDIHPGNGSIFLLSPIDREENAWHNISVIASEFNNPRQNSSVNVYIRVLDVNDNPPCFNQSIYEFRVLESSKNGSVVGRVRAIDRDIGQNAEMFFTIVGGDGMDVFQISTDKETQEGIITVREPLDFERKQLYTVEIQVENTHVDQRFPLAGIKDNATVRISVEDVDEEPPQFDKAWYMMEVKEDAEVGTTVGAVSAVDPDGSRIPIKYAIDRRTDLDRVFDIHPGNGSIFLLSPIDREENAWHNISVIASEFNNPRQNSSVNVYIRVLDVNDNAPVLATTTETYVCEKSKAGQWIQTISAVDPDKPSSGHRFFFSLAPEGADRSNFTVRDNGDNTAAILTRRTSYSWLERSKYLVSVVITNADYPVQSSTSTLTVRVCTCDSHGNMELCNAKTLNISPGLSTGVLIFIPLCAVILLMIVFLFVALIMNKKRGSLNISKEDVWGNVANHNEEGGGEQDTLAFDMRVLRHPDSAPIRLEEPAEQRRDIVPTDTLFCKPPTPPYDSLMTYAYEGTGSVAESLSSLGSASSESDQDYQYLSEWGARFRKLSDLYGVEVADDQEL